MSPTDSRVEVVLLTVLTQLAVIIAAARVCAIVFRRLGQPEVCGEIAAGLILGPSVFGRYFPDVSAWVFRNSVAGIFSVLSQLGLIFLMFLIGLDFDFGHLRASRRAAFSISLAGILLPFALGLGVAYLLYPVVGGSADPTGFALFIATALSITALPILGRMLIEFRLNHNKLGCLTISAAALDDVSGWIILALVSAIVRARFSPASTLLMIVETAGYALVMMLVVRPALKRWTARVIQRGKGEVPLTGLAIVVVIVLLSAIATNLIGLFSIFGGFLTGAIMHDLHEFRDALIRKLRDFVTVFFLPIFFTYTGLRTDIGTMTGAGMWALCALLLFAAIVGKFGGCAAVARLNGFSWKESCAIGILMNTRALMELVVVNIGLDLGVIPKSVFFMLVVMAVVTTYMTTPLLRLTLRHTELAPLFERPPIFGRRPAATALT